MATTFGPTALATPANAVTGLRVLLTPLLLASILSAGPSLPGAALWIFLAVTDGLDGYLARRQGTTRSGAFLDPLADKLLVLGALGALVVEGLFWWLPVALIATREVAMSLYRGWVGRHGISIPARESAKVKTVVQVAAVGLILVPVVAHDHRWLAVGVLWAALALTLFTGVQYLADARRRVVAV